MPGVRNNKKDRKEKGYNVGITHNEAYVSFSVGRMQHSSLALEG